MLNTRALSAYIVSALKDAKAVDIQVIDVRKLTDITDQMIICSGTSDRHVKSLAREVMTALIDQDTSRASIEGEDLGEWILIDYIDVLVHIMKRETREYYDLESLWDKRLIPQAHEHEYSLDEARRA